MKKGANFMCFLDRIYQPILCNNGGPMLNLICLTARRDEKSFVRITIRSFLKIIRYNFIGKNQTNWKKNAIDDAQPHMICLRRLSRSSADSSVSSFLAKCSRTM